MTEIYSFPFVHISSFKIARANYIETLPMGRLNQTDHILMDRGWVSGILDVRILREAGCDTDHCLVFASWGKIGST